MISLGIAYSFQKCNKIPINKYDFKLDYIFTERGIISSKNKYEYFITWRYCWSIRKKSCS